LTAQIRLWDFKTGAETVLVEASQTDPHDYLNTIDSLRALPDGRLASISRGTIRIWDVKTGAETNFVVGSTDGYSQFCVLPDRRLAAGDDNTIRLWDAKNRS